MKDEVIILLLNKMIWLIGSDVSFNMLPILPNISGFPPFQLLIGSSSYSSKDHWEQIREDQILKDERVNHIQ